MQRNWDYWKNTFKKLLWNSLFYSDLKIEMTY